MLPSFSSLAFLTAGVLSVWIRRQAIPWQVKAGAIAWAIASLALAILPWIPSSLDIPVVGAIAFTAFGMLYAMVVAILWLLRRPAAAAAFMGLGMMLVIAILFGLYFPDADYLRIPQRAGEELRQRNARDAIMIGFTEPSLAFYQGGSIRPQPENYLVTQPPVHWPSWIVLTSDVYDSLPPNRRGQLEQIASFHGFDYNIPMRPVTVIVARKRSDVK
jgi:hypothetical protein